MKNNKPTIGYDSPTTLVCEMQIESIICTSTGLDDLIVKDTQDWGWEE